MTYKRAILYLPYLPNIAWVKHFLKYEEVQLEREENFVKSTYRSRCEIAGANGRQTLSIPVIGGRDHHQLYKDVKISYQNDWQRIHSYSIRSVYGSAPYFEHYAEKFQPFYERQFEFLFEYNAALLSLVLQLLRIDKAAQFTSSYKKELVDAEDLRGMKVSKPIITIPYYQVFAERNGFETNLSIIDLLMNEGPAACKYFGA